MEVKYATATTETIDNYFPRSSDKEKQHQPNRRCCRIKKKTNVRSLFPAPCWKVFFFASRKQFILWAQQNQCVCGGCLMTYLKDRLKKMALHPDEASKKHHQSVLWGHFWPRFFTQKDVYIIRIIRSWVRVPVDDKNSRSLEIKSELCIFTFQE